MAQTDSSLITMADELPDSYAVACYLKTRGNSQRHTLAMASAEEVQEAHSKIVQPIRTRRTGLLTVMERPVISPELVFEVENRMNRQYTPPKLHHAGSIIATVAARGKSFCRSKKPSILATVQENNRIARDSLKEINSLHLPVERYSPVRRASEGCTTSIGVQYRSSPQHMFDKETNVKSLQQEYQQLQRHSGSPDPQFQENMQMMHSLHIQQMMNSPQAMLSPMTTPQMSPTPSPPICHSPCSISGSPIRHNPNICGNETNSALINRLQRLQLQQQQSCRSPEFQHYIPSGSSPCHSPTLTTSVTSITQGLSGLNTGSITQGTPSPNLSGMPLDLRVSATSSPHHLHHRSPSSTPLQHSPSNSPALGMIEEEKHFGYLNKSHHEHGTMNASLHPQISLTDESGDVVTLVSCPSNLSCNSELSESGSSCMIIEEPLELPSSFPLSTDSLISRCLDSSSSSSSSSTHIPTQPYNIPSFMICEPYDPTRPSIVRGIGKQQPLDVSNKRFEFGESRNNCLVNHSYSPQTNDLNSDLRTIEERRDLFALQKNVPAGRTFPPICKQDSSFCIADTCPSDPNISISLSESTKDANNIYCLNNTNLFFNNVSNSKYSKSTGNVFASELQKTSSGSFKVTLSDFCSQLKTSDILSLVKNIIDSRTSPKGFSVLCNLYEENRRLALECSSTGLQIEVIVCENADCELKDLKMRRISGDHLQYNQLCQELIACMTV